MTKQKTFKRRVRERMAKTGESYASAREALIGAEPAGIHPETSALRFALADAGIEITEALTLIIAGGAGAACMSFHYAKEDFTHLHLSGWNPFQSDIRDAVERLRPDRRRPRDRRREDRGADAARAPRGRRGPDRLGRRGHAARRRGGAGHGLPRDRRPGRRRRRGPHLRPHAADRPGRAPGRGPRAHPQGPPPPAGRSPAAKPTSSTPSAPGLERCAHGPLNPPSPGMSLAGIARWADDLAEAVPGGQAPRRRAARHDRRDPAQRRRSAAQPAGPGPARSGRPSSACPSCSVSRN